MTNQELYDEIKELRKDMKIGHESQALELKELRKEFYLFKGKFATISSIFVILISIFGDFVKRKLGM